MQKETIAIIILIPIIILTMIYGINRIEKINNGEMTQVSESYMDR